MTVEGGISDMVDDLNSSKIMYAYCKVLDPNTNLPKFVLINWQGEAAPESMKFKCANHLRDVTNFFHGIHVTVNARTEDDMDEDDILKKVAKSSGSQYSIHKEKSKPQEPIAAVAKEAEERERQLQERMKAINQQRAAERRASQSDDQQQKKQWELDQEQAARDEEERGHRADQLRRERAAEAEKLASAKTSTARSYFKRKESQSEDTEDRPPPPRRQLKHNFGEVDQEEPPAARQPIQLPRKQPSPPPTQPAREPSPPPQRQPSPPPQREASPPPREPSPPPKRQPSPPPAQAPTQPPAGKNLLAENLPPRHGDSDEEEADEDWGEEGKSKPAADDTEVTFDPDDVLTHVEQIDEGWWIGTAPNGSRGMFPANYVEIIQS
ncbi:DBNL-like protein [Mya arenaria]|uniref:DBNL-like protein n=1 Tax=Mya arenaria TaxID=6604 RepID=A0ABY7FTV3_MYAAR|nr:DBNL-like protein [Mya arenaria]